LFHQHAERQGLRFAGAHCLQLTFGQTEVFEILKVLEDDLANVDSLGPARRLGGPMQSALYIGWQSNS
jgi:hypothetical protein